MISAEEARELTLAVEPKKIKCKEEMRTGYEDGEKDLEIIWNQILKAAKNGKTKIHYPNYSAARDASWELICKDGQTQSKEE